MTPRKRLYDTSAGDLHQRQVALNKVLRPTHRPTKQIQPKTGKGSFKRKDKHDADIQARD